jgi:hypothetical protein
VNATETHFEGLVLAISEVIPRNEIKVEEIPSPQRLAPFSIALSAEVSEGESSGRLVLLHDPAGQDGWSGRYRIVSYVRAEVEEELAGDPMLIEIGWSWLKEGLDQFHCSYLAESGTVTQIRSASFGSLEKRGNENEIEIRASWTPLSQTSDIDITPSEIKAHIKAWLAILETAAGLSPIPEGVTQLRQDNFS